MANDVQILDKLQRNCEQLGISVTRSDADTLVASGITITYSPADILSPMGGIDDSSNPFLGIGIANPGKIKLATSGDFGDEPAVLADILADSEDLQVFHICAGMANNILLEATNTNAGGSSEDFNAEIKGHVDLLGMGQ